MRRACTAWALAALALAAAAAPAAPPRLRFRHLGTADGLSQGRVNAIVQDERGFLWFGTQEGLNRYDGYELEVFRHDEDDPASISGGEIYALARGADGELWVGTDRGLDRLDPRSLTFTRYTHDPSDSTSLSEGRVQAVARGPDGTIWIGTSGGLNRLDPEGGGFVRILHRPDVPSSLAHDDVRDLAVDGEGNLWVATRGGGLDRLVPGSGEFRHFRHDHRDAASLSSDKLRSVFVDSNGRVWVGTYEHGLHRLVDVEGGRFAHYLRTAPGSEEVRLTVRTVFEDDDGRLWVGTDGGLWLWSEEHDSFHHYRHADADPTSLADDRVQTIRQDAGGVLWVGTEGGLDRWNPQTAYFTHHEADARAETSLSSDVVMSLHEGPGGVLWVGTHDGLNRYDPAEDSWTTFHADPDDPRSLTDDRVTALLVDSRGDLWAGTQGGGLNRLRADGEGFDHHVHDAADPTSLSGDGITVLQEDATDPRKLWVGSFDGGLDLLDVESGRAVQFSPPGSRSGLGGQKVISLAQEAAPGDGEPGHSVLWIGTYRGGLHRLDRSTGLVTRYLPDGGPDSPAGDTVYALHLDRRGDLWIGYHERGLDRWRAQDRSRNAPILEHFGAADGLPNETIYAILEDPRGRLWVSTNDGLARLDPLDRQVRVFDETHGLQGSEFNHGAAHRGAEGRMYFGGPNGFNSFDTDRLPINDHAPPVRLTAFYKLNRPVPLPPRIEEEGTILLGHRDYVVSFEFAALDFAAPEKNRYAYRLEGLDEELVDIGTLRRATYTNLEPGSYTLRVLAANNDGVWNEEGLSVDLEVLPAPWATWWAYTLYALVATALVSGWLRSLRHRLHRESEHARQLEVEVGQRTRELEARNRDLQRAIEALERASVTDPMTGLHNRRFLAQLMESDAPLARRRSEGGCAGTSASGRLVFLMVDLDGLKEINDAYGHAAGDAAILAMRDLLLESCRRSDTVVRMGGDEFVVIGRDADVGAAERLAERLRQRVDRHRLQLDGAELRLSCSIGFAFFPLFAEAPRLLGWEGCLTLADRALYAAKASGRNTWVGLIGKATPRCPEGAQGGFRDVVALVESSAVTVRTSLDHPGDVAWRAPGAEHLDVRVA